MHRIASGTRCLPSTDDVGPIISADATSLVAPWLSGQPNYGFVLRGASENLGGQTNEQCYTTYVNPVLTVTYY
ncbi:MAG: hypothetical protein ABR591_07380 [Candidatus Velthaea sp.]